MNVNNSSIRSASLRVAGGPEPIPGTLHAKQKDTLHSIQGYWVLNLHEIQSYGQFNLMRRQCRQIITSRFLSSTLCVYFYKTRLWGPLWGIMLLANFFLFEQTDQVHLLSGAKKQKEWGPITRRTAFELGRVRVRQTNYFFWEVKGNWSLEETHMDTGNTWNSTRNVTQSLGWNHWPWTCEVARHPALPRNVI